MVQMARLKNVPCTNKPQKILLLIMHVVFLRIFSFLWIMLITHPGHTNPFLETNDKVHWPRMRGPRKTNTQSFQIDKLIQLIIASPSFNKIFEWAAANVCVHTICNLGAMKRYKKSRIGQNFLIVISFSSTKFQRQFSLICNIGVLF